MLAEKDTIIKSIKSNKCFIKYHNNRQINRNQKDVLVLVKQVDDLSSPIVMIEKDEETPMHQPYSILHLTQLWCKALQWIISVSNKTETNWCQTDEQAWGIKKKKKKNLWINYFFQAIEFFKSNIPVLHQYLSCQLSPQRTQAPFTICAQSPILVQIISSTRIVPTFKLKFGKLIQCLYLISTNLNKRGKKGRRIHRLDLPTLINW